MIKLIKFLFRKRKVWREYGTGNTWKEKLIPLLEEDRLKKESNRIINAILDDATSYYCKTGKNPVRARMRLPVKMFHTNDVHYHKVTIYLMHGTLPVDIDPTMQKEYEIVYEGGGK